MLLAAMARYAPQCEVVPVVGGGSCWVRLPAGVHAAELATRAAARGVLIEPGDVFFIADPAPTGYVRLGYQAIPVERIEPGIRVFAEVLAGCEREAEHLARAGRR